MASRNRKNVKKRGRSKLSLPPQTPPSQAPSQGSEQEEKKDNKPPITSPVPYMGPERENGSEEISFEEEDGYDEFKNMRYVDLPTELQMKVSYWNDYLHCQAVYEIVRDVVAVPPEVSTELRTKAQEFCENLERVREHFPEDASGPAAWFTPEELEQIEVGVVPTEREREWDRYLDELDAEEEEEVGDEEANDGSSEKTNT